MAMTIVGTITALSPPFDLSGATGEELPPAVVSIGYASTVRPRHGCDPKKSTTRPRMPSDDE